MTASRDSGNISRLPSKYLTNFIVMPKILISLALGASLLISVGCATHQLDIQQGNVIEVEAVEQLEIGMTKRQVKFLLGTSLLSDPFHHQRWDYVYWLKKSRQPEESQHLSLFFENEKLSKIVTANADNESVNEQ